MDVHESMEDIARKLLEAANSAGQTQHRCKELEEENKRLRALLTCAMDVLSECSSHGNDAHRVMLSISRETQIPIPEPKPHRKLTITTTWQTREAFSQDLPNNTAVCSHHDQHRTEDGDEQVQRSIQRKATPTDINATPTDLRAAPNNQRATHIDQITKPNDPRATPNDQGVTPTYQGATPTDQGTTIIASDKGTLKKSVLPKIDESNANRLEVDASTTHPHPSTMPTTNPTRSAHPRDHKVVRRTRSSQGQDTIPETVCTLNSIYPHKPSLVKIPKRKTM